MIDALLLQCSNYTAGKISGSLCKPLCITKEVEFKSCLGHGVKLHVLEAEWNGERVVLKAPKGLGSSGAIQRTDALFPRNNTKNRKMFLEDLIYHVSKHCSFF